MTDKKSNKYAAEKRDLIKRLSQDVHVILSACIHEFEEGNAKGKKLDEDCFDVDAIIAGRLRPTRQLHERRTGRKMEKPESLYRGSIARGLFIPHQNLFDRVVNAHRAS